MAAPAKPLVYLVLGATGSGRREVVADLIEAGLGPDETASVLVADGEPADAADARLPRVERWAWRDDVIVGTLPAGVTRIFFLTDGRANPVEQIEVFKAWLAAQGGELGRVLTVVDCQRAERHPALLAWYDACVHFSDIVLLNRREGVANKWLSDFTGHFKKQFVPSLFELVKEGKVRNPALVLEPQARRLSHFLDEEQDWVFTDLEGDVVDEDDETEGEQEITAAEEVDPYLERDAAGRRVKRLPDIGNYP